jgi:hypothetical protein
MTGISTMAQGLFNDVVYLKNGSIIKGTVLEYIPSKTLKIKTTDGSIFVYKAEECDSIKKGTTENIPSDPFTMFEQYKERQKIKRDTPRAKFAKKCYYAGIFEFDHLIGQSQYDIFYYKNNYKLIILNGIHLINGIQFLKNFYVGIGIGINFNSHDEMIDYNSKFKLSFPAYLDFRWYIGNKKLQPYLNASGGVLLPLSYLANKNASCFYFINPVVGIKTNLTARTMINIGLGYSMIFNEKILQTEGYPYNYTQSFQNIDYLKHKVINEIQGVNLKIGFTF